MEGLCESVGGRQWIPGGVSVVARRLDSSTILDDSDALAEILTVNGDPGPDPILPPHVVASLGEQLPAYYSHLMSEPVPDRLVEILTRLDRTGSSHDGE
jgi:Anti-sigma factor NepR